MAPMKAVRGFTLLEMILSIAVLASVAMLGSALWTQSAESSSLAQGRERGLLLQRVGALLRDQWADRRVLALPGESESEQRSGGVRIAPGLLGFTTARPILFPDAPLARVEYLVRERADGSFDLLYTEQRVLRFDAAPDEDGEHREPSVLAPEQRRGALVLLQGCELIRMERYGLPDEPELDEDEKEEGQRRGEDAEPVRVRNAPAPKPAWHEFSEKGRADVTSNGVRLQVRYRGEEALWVFVVRPSR